MKEGGGGGMIQDDGRTVDGGGVGLEMMERAVMEDEGRRDDGR